MALIDKEEEMDAEFEPLLDQAFDIDPDETTRDDPQQAEPVLSDETIKLLRRDNRVGIARGNPSPVTSSAAKPGRSVVIVPLFFALQAHPECVYRWARIVIDLSPTNDAIITEMYPSDVQDLPVEIKKNYGAELSLSIAAVKVGLHPETSQERTVFFPVVAAAGTGFHKAYWDFYPKAGDYLHADKELFLAIEAPSGIPVMATLTVRARVSFRGLKRLIPLLARTGGPNLPAPVRLS